MAAQGQGEQINWSKIIALYERVASEIGGVILCDADGCAGLYYDTSRRRYKWSCYGKCATSATRLYGMLVRLVAASEKYYKTLEAFKRGNATFAELKSAWEEYSDELEQLMDAVRAGGEEFYKYTETPARRYDEHVQSVEERLISALRDFIEAKCYCEGGY